MIKTLRKKLSDLLGIKVSQKSLGALTGRDQRTVESWEQNRRKPRYKALTKIKKLCETVGMKYE